MVPLTPSAWLGRVLLFSCLTLVVTVGGVVVVGRQWLQEAEPAGRGSQPVGQVLAATDEQPEGLPDALIFRIKTEFLDLMQAQQVQVSESLIVDGDTVLNGGLTVEGGAAFAGDIAFDAITVSGDISITDGDITAEGSNINLGDGTITASNIVYEVLAGDGISIDGTQTVTITNDDRGSAQKIFGKVKVGDVTLTADSNTDTLTLSAGSGVGLSTGSSNTVTISADNLSGWYKPSSTIVSLITSTNNVGIGTSAPTNKLEIDSGSTNVSGLSFTQLTSGSPSGVGGGKVLSLDSGGRVILVTDQTGDTPTAESVLPDAETGGTLYFNGTNWVSSTNLFHNGGSVGISTTSPAGRFHTYTNAIGTIGAIIQGYSGQTANLQEWRNGAGSVLSYIDADGVFNGSANVAGSIDPGLTQGQVAFQGADGLAGSNNLFWNNSTGRLGIGTATPSQVLDVNGNINVRGNKIVLPPTSGNSIGFDTRYDSIYWSSGNNVSMNSRTTLYNIFDSDNTGTGHFSISRGSYVPGSGTDLFRIDYSGNVGIGTTTPTAKLHIKGVDDLSSTTTVSVENSSGQKLFEILNDRTVSINSINSVNGNTRIGTGTGTIYFAAGYNNALTRNHLTFYQGGAKSSIQGFNTDPGIAIGYAQTLTNPNAATTLSVKGSGSSNTTKALVVENGSLAKLLTVQDDGNVGIGTTGPAGLLHLYQSSYGSTPFLKAYDGAYNYQFGGTAILASNTIHLRGTAGNTELATNIGNFYLSMGGQGTSNAKLWVNSNGNIGIGTTTPLGKLHVEGAATGKALAILNETGDQNILVASASGVTKFWLANNGNIDMGNQLTIGGATSTAGALYFFNNGVRIERTGNSGLSFTTGGSGVGGGSTFYGSAAGVPLSVQGATSQSSNLQEWKNSSSTVLAAINASGNFGLGTTTPSAGAGFSSTGVTIADVDGSNEYPFLSLKNSSRTWTLLGGLSGGGFGIREGTSNDYFFINTAGNVGIGTASPGTHKLEVNSSTGIGAYYDKSGYSIRGIFQHGGNASGINSAGGLQIAAQPASQATLGSGNIRFFTAGANSAGATTDATLSERMTIQYDGNVGIGTTSPQYKLHTVGTAYVSGALRLGDSGTSGAPSSELHIDDSDPIMTFDAFRASANQEIGTINFWNQASTLNLAQIQALTDVTTNAARLEFKTGSGATATTKLTINPGGNIGIGSTTPGQALDVVGNARFSAVGSDAYASDLHLTADGTLTTAASDVRLKKDLVELNDTAVLDRVLQLKTYNFNWKSNNSQDIGMVAQEVATIFPEITFTNQVDGYMGINYSRFSSLLVSALQAQQTQISSLQNTYKLSSTGTLQPINQATPAAQPTPSPTLEQPWYTKLAEAITVIKETIFSKAVRFEALAQFMANTIFTGPAEFLGAARFKGNTIITGELTVNNNQAGTVTLDAQRRTVSIAFSQPFTSVPVVTLTPTEFVTGQYKLAKITEAGFEIEVSEPQNSPITFQWHALLKESTDTNTTVQQGELIQAAEHPTPEPSATPNPSPTPATATSSAAVAGATTEASSAAEVETELE